MFLILNLLCISVKAQESTYNSLFKLTSEVSTSATNANHYNERGLIKEREGDLEGALEFYSIAVNMASKVPAYLFNKGITLQKLEKHIEAIEIFLELTEIDKTDFEAFIALGVSYGMTGQYTEAVKALDIAERLRPSFKRIYYQRGTFLNLMGDYPRAQKDFEIAVKREPSFAKAWYNRGINYKDMEKFRRAINDFNKAIELDPNHSESYLARGVAYMNINRKKEGSEDLKRAADMGVEEAKMLYEKYCRD